MRRLNRILAGWFDPAIRELQVELRVADRLVDELREQVHVVSRQRDEARRQRAAAERAGGEHAATLATIRAVVADRRLSNVDLGDQLAAIFLMESSR